MVRSLVFPGSTTSEFREFLLYFQESQASLHIFEMRSASPPGTSVRGQVRDKILLPFRSTCCWLGTPPRKLSGICRSQDTVLSPSPSCSQWVCCCWPGLTLGSKDKGYSCRYKPPGYVIFFSFPDLLCEPNRHQSSSLNTFPNQCSWLSTPF